MTQSTGEFSVCQFFANGEHEYVRRYVSAEEAMKAFEHYTNNVAVRMGEITGVPIVPRVIITDGSDAIVREWIAGKGVVFG